ncbi:MAG: hypothetical protein ABTQ25_19935 [Nitrosomonas ureae]
MKVHYLEFKACELPVRGLQVNTLLYFLKKWSAHSAECMRDLFIFQKYQEKLFLIQNLIYRFYDLLETYSNNPVKRLAMIKSKLLHNNIYDIDPEAMSFDDEDALADGMIPDSRIVKLIDELETGDDDLCVVEESEIAIKSLGFHQYYSYE